MWSQTRQPVAAVCIRIAHRADKLTQNSPALLCMLVAVAFEARMGPMVGCEFWPGSALQVACEHLLLFAPLVRSLHRTPLLIGRAQ